MDHPQHLRTWMLVALAASALRCGDNGSSARPQVILYVDTNAPIASEVLANKLLSDGSVDTLRVEVLDAENNSITARDIPAPDVANWPISFGLDRSAGSTLRVRLRAFRARDADSSRDEDSGTKMMVPDAGYTIDRVVDLPMPEKGAYAFRVVLDAQCRGARPDFVARKTCIGGGMHSFMTGLEALSPQAAHDLNLAPKRPDPWVPGDPADCPTPAFDDDRVCIPGGFFMLGNRRVVGFGLLRRIDAVPAHPVRMKAFWIDRREMTVERYRTLNPSQVVGISPLTVDGKQTCNGPKLALDPAAKDLAVNCVTWTEADATCRAQGGRLPTEAEWEYVGSGRGMGLLFPWGEAPPDCEVLSAGREYSVLGLPECVKQKPQSSGDPVGSHGTDSIDDPWDKAHDIFDLAGSMSEWTNDPYSDYDHDGDLGPNCWARSGMLVHPGCSAGSSTTYSVRGGNWAEPMAAAYVALRNAHPIGDRSDRIGFRCVYPLQGQPDPLVLLTPPGPDGGLEEAGSGGEEPRPSEPAEPAP